MAEPSPMTKPSRSLSKGREAPAGSSLHDDSAARTVAQLIVYGFRGVLLSWAHLLISDAAFRRDAELITRSLVPDDREIEETL